MNRTIQYKTADDLLAQEVWQGSHEPPMVIERIAFKDTVQKKRSYARLSRHPYHDGLIVYQYQEFRVLPKPEGF